MPVQQEIGKFLIVIGAILVVIGVLFLFRDKIPYLDKLGQLPGDLYFKKDKVSIYFPLTSSILLSIVLSLVFWFLRKH